MTRIVREICKNAVKNEETKTLPSAAAPLWVVFFDFLSVLAYFANNPTHWDGNPGIRIVNPYSPKQSQLKAEARP